MELKFNWEEVREEVLAMKADGKSHKDVADYLEFRYGKRFTNGRVSQVLKKWRENAN